MKFSINQKALNEMLSVVNKGVSPRATMPVLAGIYVEANENEVVMRSTNLELSVQVASPALIEEDGQALLPAKLFSDIVSTFKDEAVSISATPEEAEISCDKSNFKIRVMNVTEFPPFPEVETTQSVTLPFKDFSNMTKKVARMVSRDESRVILQGVNIVYQNGLLELVATDAYRIAAAKKKINIEGVESFNAVIPGSFLMDVAGLSGEIENAQVSLSQNQVVVTCNDTVFVNRRIEGNFPEYRQLIPEEKDLTAIVDKAELSDAVKRIAVLSQINPVVKFTLDSSLGIIKLNGTEQDVGSGEESVKAEFENLATNEPVEIAFNCNYVVEGLACIDTDKVKIDIAPDSMRGIFTDVANGDGANAANGANGADRAGQSSGQSPDQGEELIYILLPVRI